MTDSNVRDGGAIGDDVPIEVPVVAKGVTQQHVAGASRRAIDRVIRAHNACGVGVDNELAEGGQIRVIQVMRRNVDTKLVARRFRTAVYGEVLGGCDDLEVAVVRALQATHECGADLAGEEGVFTVGLLASAPAGIAIDVDVGRPEGETVETLSEISFDGVDRSRWSDSLLRWLGCTWRGLPWRWW